MKIFAIIVTYNAMRRQWIDRCLKSLAESTVPVVPIVIDNASIDGTRDHVPANYPEVVWLPQQQNLGFGQANNVGIRYALEHDADFVLLLNQDAAVSSSAVEDMVDVSDGESLYTPVHLNGDATSFDFMFRQALLKHPDMFVDDLYLDKTLQPSYPVGEICAACWFLPIRVIKLIGGFNPLFFHYGEDCNYYQRLVYHGFKTVLVPHARMMHDRKQFGDEQAHLFRSTRRDLLLILCDVNQGGWQRTKNVLRMFIHRPVNKWPALVVELGWVIGHIGNISRSRKAEKKKGLNWL